MKLKYRLKRFHRQHKRGYIAFGCGLLNIAACVCAVIMGRYVVALVDLMFGLLIGMQGVYAARIDMMTRMQESVAYRAYKTGFSNGVKRYAEWLRSCKTSETMDEKKEE